MTTDETQPAPAQPDGEKPAGRTGEGSQSIVAALAGQQQRVDDLVNHPAPPEPEAEPGDEAA